MSLLALAILLSAAVVDSGAAELTLLDGSTVPGRIVGWDQSKIILETPQGEHGVLRPQLLDVRMLGAAAAEANPAVMSVELIDGTTFPITGIEARNERTLRVVTPYAQGPLLLSRQWIRRIDLAPMTDAAMAVWHKVNELQPAGDILLVTKREGEQFDYLTGVVGAVTADEVEFDWDGQKVQIKRAKVAGIRFYHAKEREPGDATCALTLVDGATIQAASLTLDDERRLAVETLAHARLLIPLDQVLRADYSSGKLAYLSDLKPEQSTWTPRIESPAAAELIAGYGRPRNNESFAGSALTLAWPDEALPTGRELRTYAKGLAVRSRTELVYRIPRGMRRFSAVAGIDPATANQGHVMLEIRADDRVLWEDEVDGKRPPVEIDLDLGMARRLQFRVDYGRNLDYGDRLHLVEARVTK